ncbi:MAG: threonine--tRNA ligase [Acidobacteria bacterium]|nr:threonine--tRNA ligase [Acidobacteriota bacterium]
MAPLQTIHRDGTVTGVEDPEEALEILRHSTSHLMALAVMELYPDVHLGIGPATSEGFYYDFQTPHRLSEGDLEEIEQKMVELKNQDLSFEPSIVSQEEALDLFHDRGEDLKKELIEERAGQVLSCYKLGKLVDFCTGPHVLSTSNLGVFKLLSVAGSYWRGDEHREQLQRIYGTSFFEEAELADHLNRLEEALKRDHRKLGRELDLYSIQDRVAPGLIFWHPKGAIVRELIEGFLREELKKRGYQFVYTPHIAKSDLWKISGHYEYFRESMYILPVDEEEYVLKPMNCPFHVLIYRSQARSYRDLPQRLSELGSVYRYERSGVVQGMLRVRGMTQDDSHTFCTVDQVPAELRMLLEFVMTLMSDFGFDDLEAELSTRPEEKWVGELGLWELAETSLAEALDAAGVAGRVAALVVFVELVREGGGFALLLGAAVERFSNS